MSVVPQADSQRRSLHRENRAPPCSPNPRRSPPWQRGAVIAKSGSGDNANRPRSTGVRSGGAWPPPHESGRFEFGQRIQQTFRIGLDRQHLPVRRPQETVVYQLVEESQQRVVEAVDIQQPERFIVEA